MYVAVSVACADAVGMNQTLAVFALVGQILQSCDVLSLAQVDNYLVCALLYDSERQRLEVFGSLAPCQFGVLHTDVVDAERTA